MYCDGVPRVRNWPKRAWFGAGPGGELPPRLKAIHDGLNEVVQSLHPTAIAIEQLYSHYERPRTSILMGHARGVICLVAAQNEIPVYDYAATKVKKLLTGNGRAPKLQMQQAIQRELSLNQLPQPADVADALAVALCHFHTATTGPALSIARTIRNR